MSNNKYIGNRYVPKFFGDWDNTKNTEYESLSVVMYSGDSYTSKQPVPKGIDILNTVFWVRSGSYNAQIESYKQHVDTLSTQFNQNVATITTGLSDIQYVASASNLTDDTTMLQSLINTGAIEIKLKRNTTYKISAPLTVPDGVKIIGHNTIIQGLTTIYGLNVGNNVSIEGIQFNSFSIAINQQSKTNLSVKNCGFDTMSSCAIYVFGSNNTFIEKCKFYNITKSGIIIDNDASYVTIEKCNFDNPSVYGGYSTAQTTAHVNCLNGSHILVSKNMVKNNGGQGIVFSYNSTSSKGSKFCKAIENHAEGNGQEGITAYGGASILTSNIQIIGNTSINNRYHQIENWQVNNTIVEGNIVDEQSNEGNIGAITLYNVNGGTCVGNKVLHAVNNGIAILYGSTKCLVSNNNISETNGGNKSLTTQGHGIILDSNGGSHPSFVTVRDNLVYATNGLTSTRSAVYASTTTNMGNRIENIDSLGYQASIHYYALCTCINWSAAIPTTGTWEQRYKINNISPASAGSIGWVCTTGGQACTTTWVATTAYTVGNIVYANNKVYTCSVAGTSSSTAPSHTTGTAADGTCSWDFTNNLAVFKGYGTIS